MLEVIKNKYELETLKWVNTSLKYLSQEEGFENVCFALEKILTLEKFVQKIGISEISYIKSIDEGKITMAAVGDEIFMVETDHKNVIKAFGGKNDTSYFCIVPNSHYYVNVEQVIYIDDKAVHFRHRVLPHSMKIPNASWLKRIINSKRGALGIKPLK